MSFLLEFKRFCCPFLAYNTEFPVCTSWLLRCIQRCFKSINQLELLGGWHDSPNRHWVKWYKLLHTKIEYLLYIKPHGSESRGQVKQLRTPQQQMTRPLLVRILQERTLWKIGRLVTHLLQTLSLWNSKLQLIISLVTTTQTMKKIRAYLFEIEVADFKGHV